MHIDTPRLRLTALSAGQLRLYLDEPARLETELGHPVSRAVLTDTVRRAIGMKLAKMETAHPADHPWYTYWLVVLRQPPFGAGLVGYKGIAAGKAEVEIGYGIDPQYQGRGYTSEAARALVAWAFADPECQSILALNTLKTNPASLKILKNLGFVITAEHPGSFDLRLSR